MKEYEIFLPLRYNDGAPVEPRKLQKVQRALLERFGGVTYFPQPNEGYWRMGDVIYRDEIVIYRVVTEKRRAARRFLAQLKKELSGHSAKKRFSFSKETSRFCKVPPVDRPGFLMAARRDVEIFGCPWSSTGVGMACAGLQRGSVLPQLTVPLRFAITNLPHPRLEKTDCRQAERAGLSYSMLWQPVTEKALMHKSLG